MADINDVPGGVGGIAGIIAGTVATIAAAWRMFKAWGPSDANAAANSAAQIAALDRYEKMLEDERAARHANDTRHAEEMVALRKAWAEDVATRTSEFLAERKARQESDARAEQYNQKREEALQELWELRGQVKALQQRLQSVEAELARRGGSENGNG
jgi:Skp family chaperone for outer membrane proteins